MKTIAISPTASGIGAGDRESPFRRTRRRWATALLFSSIAAAVTGIFGLALAGASLLHFIAAKSSLGILGSALLAVTFPLLVLAAHCLDKIDDVNRAERIASLRQKIFSDVDAIQIDQS